MHAADNFEIFCRTRQPNSNPRVETLRLAREMHAINAAEELLQNRCVVIYQDQLDIYAAVLLPYPGLYSPQEVVNKLATDNLTLCASEPIVRQSVVLSEADRITSLESVRTAVSGVWKYHRGSRGHMGNKKNTHENRIIPVVEIKEWIDLFSNYLYTLVGRGEKEAYFVDAYEKKMRTPMRCDYVFLLICPERVFVLYESCEF